MLTRSLEAGRVRLLFPWPVGYSFHWDFFSWLLLLPSFSDPTEPMQEATARSPIHSSRSQRLTGRDPAILNTGHQQVSRDTQRQALPGRAGSNQSVSCQEWCVWWKSRDIPAMSGVSSHQHQLRGPVALSEPPQLLNSTAEPPAPGL